MAVESDTREAEELNQVATSGGAIDGDSTNADDPQTTQDVPSLGGRLLRFVGMTVIVAAIILATVFWEDPVTFIGLLVIGMAGAAMHYKGRKLAPGKPGASILGGILGGLASSAALIIAALFFVAVMANACKEFFRI